jgi:hypothetical protein
MILQKFIIQQVYYRKGRYKNCKVCSDKYVMKYDKYH